MRLVDANGWGVDPMDREGHSHAFDADPYLRAMQLAANIVDSRDTDHARTEITAHRVGRRRDFI